MTKRIFRNMALVAAIAIAFDSLLSNAVIKRYGTESIWLSMVVSAATIVAVTIAAWISARAIVRPLRNIDPEAEEMGEHYAEIKPLLHKISDQNAEIDRQTDELGKKSREMRLIMQNMAEGMVIYDGAGQMISCNRSAARLFDESEGFAGMDACRDLVKSALSGIHGEETMPHGDEIFRIIADPVSSDEDGVGVYGAVMVILDVTERENRDRLRREFTSNVSHELKTPLTAIYGISDMLAGGIVRPEDSTAFAEDIRREASRMISLIDDIIKLSRLDEGDGQLPMEDVDLTALAAEIIERLRVNAEAKGVTFRLIGEYAPVRGVRSVLDEMIANLCDNAIKYNKEGGAVYVSVYRDGRNTFVSVEDTGIGIPRKDQSRVFERFYRVDKSHSRRIGGTGLGLSIVKHAVAYHGGTVSLVSEEGAGTKVTVSLPGNIT